MPCKKLWGVSGTIRPLSNEELDWLLAEFEKVFGGAEDGK